MPRHDPTPMSSPLQTPSTMDEQPYTSADEDPFSVSPYIPERTVQHRRSSMLDKWISEQQSQASENAEPEPLDIPRPYFATSDVAGSSTYPYLAYPDLPRVSSAPMESNKGDVDSIISYDLVDDDDIPANAIPEPSTSEEHVTPLPPRSHKLSRHSLSPAFRALNLNFRSSPPSTPSSPSMDTPSRAFSRLSFLPRSPRSPIGPGPSESETQQQHNRSSSLSTLSFSASHHLRPLSTTSSKWRPTVLGHFHQSPASISSISMSDGQNTTPSRPSISSGDTFLTSDTSQTTTTTLDNIIPISPSKTSFFDSVRFRSSKGSSTFSVASSSSVQLPTQQTNGILQPASSSETEFQKTISRRSAFAPKPGSMLDNRDHEDDLEPPPTYRFKQHEAIRHPIPHSSGGSLSRVKFSSLNSRTQRKKKKLIVSGIGAAEVRKFEGVKRWCESFGEIRQIIRMPNGDLQIDFRDPEVADTVCRVRAKVFIANVGSVQLSWVAGNKR